MIGIKKLHEAIRSGDFLNFLDGLADYEECLRLSFQKPIANKVAKYKSKLAVISWQKHEKNIHQAVTKSLQDFVPIADIIMPESGLKGVYFCLGDSGGSLQIAGSIYYKEKDWAANADFCAEYDEENSILDEISDLFRHEDIEREYIETVEYFFIAFVLYRLMHSTKVPNNMVNAGVSLGYSDGDELIIGHFQNGNFIGEIKVVNEHEKPSSAPALMLHSVEERGDLWDYLRRNYYRYLKTEGLEDSFIRLGEAEAERICVLYEDTIFVNKCGKCNFIKMTPEASLCLNCGDFSSPLPQHKKA